MYANRLAYDPWRGRYLTTEEAWHAASNPLLWRHVQWQERVEVAS